MVAFFASGDGNVESVLLRWQRARGECGVDARRILGAVEVEDEGAGLVEAVARQGSVEEATCLIGRTRARGVAEDKEERLVGRVFDNGLKPKGLAVERELCCAGRRLVADLSEDIGDG